MTGRHVAGHADAFHSRRTIQREDGPTSILVAKGLEKHPAQRLARELRSRDVPAALIWDSPIFYLLRVSRYRGRKARLIVFLLLALDALAFAGLAYVADIDATLAIDELLLPTVVAVGSFAVLGPISWWAESPLATESGSSEGWDGHRLELLRDRGASAIGPLSLLILAGSAVVMSFSSSSR